MHTHREAMVRRAVAQHIVQQVKHRRIAKRRRLLWAPGAGIQSAYTASDGNVWADAGSIALGDVSWTQSSNINNSSNGGGSGADSALDLSQRRLQQPGSHNTEAAIAALAAALSAVHTDPRFDTEDGPCTPSAIEATPTTETQLVQRIIELQREKEYLLQMMMHQQT
ncbi:hypothetical protein EV178_006593, partial [Coemansia sp. RSA 1646]